MADLRAAEQRQQREREQHQQQGQDEPVVKSEGVHGASMQWSDEASQALNELNGEIPGKLVVLVSEICYSRSGDGHLVY